MRPFFTKPIVAILILGVLGVGLFVLVTSQKKAPEISPNGEVKNVGPIRRVIGLSVEGREIESYTYPSAQADGDGKKHLVFIGGIHGGYEWNSVVLAYQFMDYLEMYPEIVPENLTVTVIPSANPDGVYAVVGKSGRFTVADIPDRKEPEGLGRFNAHNVDLNRNFDCKWKSSATWRSKTVSAGSEPFSEPEAKAIRNFILENNKGGGLQTVIFWHSQANAVYASECEKGILPETLTIMNVYSKASGYRAIKSFDSYEITGDAEGWLASLNIPAITVELQTHETVEWERNLSGIKALFQYYGQK